EKKRPTVDKQHCERGSRGGSGSLVVTNLRVLWISHKVSRVNLSE
ncbi:unnamed protein product, partial [Laminaria digitata]